jgi:copper chaperone
MSTTTYVVDGMICDRCVSSIAVKVTTIAGVTGVEIERIIGGRSWVTVTSSTLLSNESVRAAVTAAGCRLVGISV